MLIKRAEREARRGTLAAALPAQVSGGVDRRSFLRRSGLAAGGLAALDTLPLGSVQKAEAGPPPPPGATVSTRKNVCTHCSVGCTVIAEVANGVWRGQEPGWDSPINRGSHCCKGAAVRDDVLSERRLRYPMKLVNGAWNRISWDQALVFWGALGAGAAVSVSGFLLLFPFYVTDILGMQIAQVVHSVVAVLFVALILGHIYIGTLGMEGAFEAMWTGEVDFNWAKEHHDLWLEEQLAKRQRGSQPELPSATPAE